MRQSVPHLLLIFYEIGRRGLAFKQAARNSTDFLVLRLSRKEARRERRQPASSNEHPAAASKVCQLLQRLPRYALYAGQDHNSVSAWAKIENTLACFYATDLA